MQLNAAVCHVIRAHALQRLTRPPAIPHTLQGW